MKKFQRDDLHLRRLDKSFPDRAIKQKERQFKRASVKVFEKMKKERTKMKTIKEWFKEGVTKVRLPRWNEWAYLEFSGTLDGLLHPWVYLYDIGCNGKAMLITKVQGELYEKWIPPKNYEERKIEIYGNPNETNEK